MNSKLIGAALASTLVLSATSAEAFTVYTDRTDWENAMSAAGAGPITLDTFENDIENAAEITFDSGVISTGINGTEIFN